MAEKNNKKKIVKYRKYLGLNIGTVLFGIVFVYMLVCMFLYLTSSHIAPYEVTKGTLSGNYKYTALALKSESIVAAPESGAVTYYAREGTEIAMNGVICSVNETGTVKSTERTEATESDSSDEYTEAASSGKLSSDDAKKLGRPEGFTLNVREVYASAGAGFVVVVTGAIMTMPGLPKKPAAFGIDVSDDGVITGLF